MARPEQRKKAPRPASQATWANAATLIPREAEGSDPGMKQRPI